MTPPREMTDDALRALPDAALDEIVRQAEAKMAQTVAMALAADQRATGLGAAYGAICAGLMAAGGTLAAIEHPNVPLVAGLAMAAAVFFLGTCLCFWACRPFPFQFVGNEPASLAPAAGDLSWLKRYYCREIDRRLQENAAVLARTGRWTLRGQGTAILAPLLGAAAYGLATAHPCLFAVLASRS